MYAPAEVPLTDIKIPIDGSIISIAIINLFLISRGSINLASTDPAVDPLIHLNYHVTHIDRAIIRATIRRNISTFETSQDQAIIAEEVPPADFPALTSESTDTELNAQIQRCAASFYHPAGTASMGLVVDAEYRVKGIAGLRVIDASVIPTPISAAYMVLVYALAEQMAEIIIAGNQDLNLQFSACPLPRRAMTLEEVFMQRLSNLIS